MNSSTLDFINNIKGLVLNPIIGFMFAMATVMFVYGIVEYILGAENPEKRDNGKMHMIWGVVGMFVMISVYGIMNILAGFWWDVKGSY